MRKRQRALLLRFEQAHVFDRDRRLGGKGLEQRNLFVGERSDLGSPYENCSDGATLAQQRRRKRGVPTLAFYEPAAQRVLVVLRLDIMDMNRPTIIRRSSSHRVSVHGKALAAIHSRRIFPV